MTTLAFKHIMYNTYILPRLSHTTCSINILQLSVTFAVDLHSSPTLSSSVFPQSSGLFYFLGICAVGQFLKVPLTTIVYALFQTQGRWQEVTWWDGEAIARRKTKKTKRVVFLTRFSRTCDIPQLSAGLDVTFVNNWILCSMLCCTCPGSSH